MKRYAYKLMATIAVIATFIVLINLNINVDLEKNIRTIANSEKLAATCTPSTAVIYYTTDSVSLRSTAETSTSNVLATLDKCTQVKVYCTTGSWARVSNSSSKYVSTSYLTTNSTSCSSITQTTTDAIGFNLSTPTLSTTPIYSDGAGTIKFNITNVTNLAAGEESRFDIKIQDPSGTDVTERFNVQKGTLNASAVAVSLIKKTGETFSEGTYTITVTGGSNTKSTTFSMTGKYYNFEISLEKNTDYLNNPTNKINQWTLSLIDVDPTSLNNSKFQVSIFNKDTGVDCTNKFNISFNSTTRKYTIKNIPETGDNRWTGNYAQEGDYTIKVTFYDSTYSTSRGTITRTDEITLGRASASYVEDSENRLSYRYTPVYSQEDYSIEITSKTTINGINYYTFIENGVENKLTEKKIKEIYGSLNLDNVDFNDGSVVIEYGTQVMITNYKKDSSGVYQVTYKTDSTTVVTKNATEFQTAYPTAYGVLTSGDYTFATDGSLKYKNTGTGTKNVITYSIMSDKIRIPLSTTGGEYTFYIDYKELEEYDFENATLTLSKKDGSTIILNNQVYDENFEMSWDYETYSSTKRLIIYLKYKGIDPDYYNGTYVINADFGKYGDYDIQFTLTDGNTDYYLYSEYDSHITSDDPMDGNINPQSNKKYEYYIGFYMIKGGQLLTEIDKSSINYRIYNRRADYDSNNKMYFYDQVDYEIKIKNVINNTITFDLSLDYGVTYKENQTLSLTEFSNKYGDSYDLISNYQYDSNGNLIGDNFPLQIKRFYTVAGDTDMTVEYQESGSTETKSLKLNDFKVAYPEMYGYLVTKFDFDTSGNIILGALIGNYRVTTDENGNALEGKEVSDLFDITVDTTSTSPARVITILPKTEVDPGDYYIYVSYGAAYPGVGYVNNSTEDPAISKELYPEMWNKNTHMTSFSYSEPKYTITIETPTLSNEGNTNPKNYANINGKVAFDLSLNYIYNLEGVKHKVQYYDGTSWVDATSDFTSETDYHTGDSKIVLSNVVGKVKKGKYRLCMTYSNNGYNSETTYEEFEISGNYYGLLIDNTNIVKFVHNFANPKEITATGYFVSNPENIQLAISRVVDDSTYDEYVWDSTNHQFVSQTGTLEFTYETEYTNIDENTIEYVLRLKNNAFVTPIGTYLLKMTYQETNGDLATSEFTFSISDDEYGFSLGEETAVANATEQYVKRPVSVRYFDYDYLDDIKYTIYYRYENSYVDVSSEDSEMRMFKFRYAWEERPNLDEFEEQKTIYEGTLYIDIDKDAVDLDGSYYIELRYGEVYDEFEMGNLREMFQWDIIGTSIYGNFIDLDGNTTKVDGFYNNIEDTTIDVTLDTAHEETINYSINTECLEETCVPSQAINYNNRFDLITNENNHIVLKLKEGLEDNLKLEQKTYALTLYYSDTDYRVIRFEVIGDYVSIELGEYSISSKISSTKNVAGKLFSNKEGTIKMPVKVSGVDYEDTQITITDITGNVDMTNYFSYDKTEYNTNHNLVITYNPLSVAPAGDYIVLVTYTNYDGSIESDNMIFTMSEIYYNYEVTKTTYSPSPAIPNIVGGGNIIMLIETEDMISGDTITTNNIKQKFVDNIKVVDANGNDITDKLTISYAQADEYVDFNLVIKYDENALEPGIYTVNMAYTISEYEIKRTYEFEMGDYERRIDIESIEIITDTNDEKIHTNIGGTMKINYSSNYNIFTNDLIVSVLNENNEDVTSSFSITKTSDYVLVIYEATDPYLEVGKYTINLLYTDPQTGNVDNNSTILNIYAEYKDIVISEMTSSSTKIYADLEGQFYTYKLQTSTLTTDEISNMKTRIYDEYGNLVYSDISEDAVQNQFEVEKNSDEEYKINILAYKARVGNYYAVACLENSDGSYLESNKLQFVINTTYYTVSLKDTSTIKTIDKINGKETIYDYIGAHAIYQFTCDYDKGGEKYSIKVYQSGKLLTEIKDITVQTATGYLQTEFDVIDVAVGELEVAICLNGLAYDSKTINVSEYIKVTNAVIVMDNADITGDLSLKVGDTKTLEFIVEPSNATNKNLTFTSSNTEVVTIDGNTLNIIGEGTTTIKLSNKEYSQEFKVNVEAKITSEIYEIDYTNNTIYVNSMNSLKLTKDTFISNLSGLYQTYTILDSKQNDVTSTTAVIGTNYSIINGNDNYKVILIGDLVNGNGSIDLGDVSYLFQLYRGKVSTTDENILKAAHIRKDTSITLGDVAKLFQLYRGKINEI